MPFGPTSLIQQLVKEIDLNCALVAGGHPTCTPSQRLPSRWQTDEIEPFQLISTQAAGDILRDLTESPSPNSTSCQTAGRTASPPPMRGAVCRTLIAGLLLRGGIYHPSLRPKNLPTLRTKIHSFIDLRASLRLCESSAPGAGQCSQRD
jgi:hypothetical protein